MKRRNGGYTLVELIVVITILAVLSSMAVLSFSVVSSTGARRCASEIDGKISECKINCMSRADAKYLRLYMQDGKVHGEYVEGEKHRDDLLSGKQVKVVYSFDNAEPVEITETENLYISFDRSSGGLENFSALESGTVARSTKKGTISVTGGLRTYTVTVDALTGSHVLGG